MPGDAALPANFDGPPAPVFPAVISRDAAGRATVRAVRVSGRCASTGGSTRRSTPRHGDLRFHPDGAGRGRAGHREDRGLARVRRRQRLRRRSRCWESQPERMVANEMRRDSSNICSGNDIVVVHLRHVPRPAQRRRVRRSTRSAAAPTARSPTSGSTTATGTRSGTSRSAGSTAAGRSRWRSRSSRCATGPGDAQIWGFNARAINRWKNEMSYLTPMPPALGPARRSAGVAGARRWSASRRRPASRTSRSSRTRSRT